MVLFPARYRPARSAVLAAVITASGMTALAVRPSVAAAADTYPIKLDRPYKVGQQFTIVSKGDLDQAVKVTANGQAQPGQTTKFAAELTGTVKVLAVSEKFGDAIKEEVTVDKLTKDGAELYPTGTVIVADHTGAKVAYTANGKPVEPEQAAVLELLVNVDRADKQVSQDGLMGTPTPQPVGGHWEADAAKMAADMKDEQIPVSAEHLKATSTLVTVEQVDGKPVETIEVKITADPLEAGMDMNGLTVTGGSLDGTVQQMMPVDATLPQASLDVRLTVKLKGTANGGAVVADITINRNVHTTMTPKG